MSRQASGARLSIEWGLVLLAAMAAVVAMVAGHATERLDNAAYDLMLRGATRRVDPRILLVTIDDRSLKAEGRWPWPRARDAALVRALQAGGARAIALDMLMPPGEAREDAELAAAMRGPAPVFLPVHFRVPGQNGAGFDLETPAASLARAAAGLGQVNLAFDGDGNVRHAYLTYAGGGRVWPHLAMLLAGPYRMDEPPPAAGALEARDPVMIAYAGPQGSFPAVSATSVLRGEIPAEVLRGRLVLVGATASGLGDAYATPFSDDTSLMPGVEIQANVLNMRLTGAQVAMASPLMVALAALVPLVLLHVAMWGWAPRRSLPLAIGLIVAVAVGSGLLLAFGHVWCPPVAAMIGLAGLYPVWMWRRLSVVSAYMTAELDKLSREHDLLERPRPDLTRADFVDRQMGLLRSAIDRERDLRRFLKDRVSQMPDAVIVADNAGRVVLANRNAQVLAEDLCGGALAHVDPLLGALDPGLPLAADWPGTAFPCGRQVESADGRTFDVRFEPQQSEAGTPLGVVIRLADVSLGIRLQRQREDVLQLLSHDMRAPSASIVALVDMVGKGAPAETVLPRLRDHAQRTLALADDFVQLSRAELKPLDLQPVDLIEVVQTAADSLWPRATERQVRVELDLACDDLWVLGEAAMLVRVFVNLLDNALKFSTPGQSIRVAVWAEAGRALCRVADDGPGIAPDRLQSIFEKFRSAPAGPFRNLGGTGLGLAFVHTVAARHRGRIQCESRLGVGTAFTLDLPAMPEPA